ncbi:growth regulator-like protein [Sesbania bispinosa]|nr:growth regulator-like protein [Sesbania bispinosa]
MISWSWSRSLPLLLQCQSSLTTFANANANTIDGGVSTLSSLGSRATSSPMKRDGVDDSSPLIPDNDLRFQGPRLSPLLPLLPLCHCLGSENPNSGLGWKLENFIAERETNKTYERERERKKGGKKRPQGKKGRELEAATLAGREAGRRKQRVSHGGCCRVAMAGGWLAWRVRWCDKERAMHAELCGEVDERTAAALRGDMRYARSCATATAQGRRLHRGGWTEKTEVMAAATRW